MRWENDHNRNDELNHVFGGLEQLEGVGNDLIHLIQNVSEKTEIPVLLQVCGTEDYTKLINISAKN